MREIDENMLRVCGFLYFLSVFSLKLSFPSAKIPFRALEKDVFYHKKAVFALEKDSLCVRKDEKALFLASGIDRRAAHEVF